MSASDDGGTTVTQSTERKDEEESSSSVADPEQKPSSETQKSGEEAAGKDGAAKDDSDSEVESDESSESDGSSSSSSEGEEDDGKAEDGDKENSGSVGDESDVTPAENALQIKGKAPTTLGKNTMITRAAKLAIKKRETGEEVTDEELGSQGKTNLAKKFQGQHQSLIREPVLCLAPVNENWALDVFSILHNGVRREMMDLYFILGEMRKMYLGLAERDIDMFYEWFEVFGGFLLDYFAVEEEVIYPWIEAKGAKLSGDLGVRNRMQMRGRVGHVMYKMEDARENGFQHLNYSEQYKKILEFIDSLSSKLLDYFTAEEHDLPPIITKYYKPADKKKLDKTVFKFFLDEGRYPWAYASILTRWMDSDKLRVSWLSSHIPARQKLEYRSWPQKFSEEHSSFTKKFTQRATEFSRQQEEAANQKVISGDLDLLEDLSKWAQRTMLESPRQQTLLRRCPIGRRSAKGSTLAWGATRRLQAQSPRRRSSSSVKGLRPPRTSATQALFLPRWVALGSSNPPIDPTNTYSRINLIVRSHIEGNKRAAEYRPTVTVSKYRRFYQSVVESCSCSALLNFCAKKECGKTQLVMNRVKWKHSVIAPSDSA